MAKENYQGTCKKQNDVPNNSYKQKIRKLKKSIEKVQDQKMKSLEERQKLLEQLEAISKKHI